MSRAGNSARGPRQSVSRRSATAAYWTGFRPRSQLFGPFPYAAETEEKVVALSFDDGPNEPYTSRLLDTLDSLRREGDVLSGRALRATLSVRNPASRAERTCARQPQLQPLFTRYLKQPRQEIEIIRSQEVFYSITGLTPALYRPPWLCHWPWVMSSLRQHGLQVVSGTFAHPLEIFQPAAASWPTSAARLTRPARS